MTGTTLPLAYDLTIYCGTTFEAMFRWLPDGSNPQDFTGWSAGMKIGRVGGPLVAELGTFDYTIILSATGQIILSLPAVGTAALPPGTYSYALNLTDSHQVTTAFLRGRVEIVADIGEP